MCALAAIQDSQIAGGSLLQILLHVQPGSPERGQCPLMKPHKLDDSMETTSEIRESTSHDCPIELKCTAQL